MKCRYYVKAKRIIETILASIRVSNKYVFPTAITTFECWHLMNIIFLGEEFVEAGFRTVLLEV